MLPNEERRCAGVLLAVACSTCDRRNWRPGVLHEVMAPEVSTPMDGTEYGSTCPNYIPEPEFEG